MAVVTIAMWRLLARAAALRRGVVRRRRRGGSAGAGRGRGARRRIDHRGVLRVGGARPDAGRLRLRHARMRDAGLLLLMQPGGASDLLLLSEMSCPHRSEEHTA